jgi:hypothetical protein
LGASEEGEYVPERQNVVPEPCASIAAWISPAGGTLTPEQAGGVGAGGGELEGVGVGEEEGELEGSGVGEEEGAGADDGVGVSVGVGEGVSVIDGDGVGTGTTIKRGGRGPCRLENLIERLDRLLMANEYEPTPWTNRVTSIFTHRRARREPDRTYLRAIAGRDLNVNLDSLHRLLAG